MIQLNDALETLQAKQEELLRGDVEVKVNEITTETVDRAMVDRVATVDKDVTVEMAVMVDKAVTADRVVKAETAQREADTTGTTINAETEEYLETETNVEADVKECLDTAVCGDTIDGDTIDREGENDNVEPEREDCMDAELVTAGSIVNFYVGIEQMGCVFLINAGGYPAFAEIEIEFFERDGYGKGGTQGFERFLGTLVVGVLRYVFLNHFRFGNDVAGYEFVGYLIVSD